MNLAAAVTHRPKRSIYSHAINKSAACLHMLWYLRDGPRKSGGALHAPSPSHLRRRERTGPRLRYSGLSSLLPLLGFVVIGVLRISAKLIPPRSILKASACLRTAEYTLRLLNLGHLAVPSVPMVPMAVRSFMVMYPIDSKMPRAWRCNLPGQVELPLGT